MEGIFVFVWILGVVWSVLCIILFIKVWVMTNDVKDIKNYLCSSQANAILKAPPSNKETKKKSIIHNNIQFQEGDVVVHKDSKEELRIIQLTMNDTAAICANSKGEEVTYYLNSLVK